MNSGRRDYLSIRLKSGSIVTFTEFNASQNARPTSEVWAAHWAALKHLHGEST